MTANAHARPAREGTPSQHPPGAYIHNPSSGNDPCFPTPRMRGSLTPVSSVYVQTLRLYIQRRWL